MSDRAEVKLTILEAVVKGYYECSFAVRVGDKFVVKQKRLGSIGFWFGFVRLTTPGEVKSLFFTLVKLDGPLGVLVNTYKVYATTLLGLLWPNISTLDTAVGQR